MSSKNNFSKRYTTEFKRDALELALSSGKARHRGRPGPRCDPESLRGWVKQAMADQGEGPAGALTSDEKEELRRESREQQQTTEIDAEKAAEDNPGGYSVSLLYRVVGANRSTYASWLAAQPAAIERRRAEDELAVEIREIHGNSRGAYGAPRVHAVLRRRGHGVNRKKVKRIMREHEIRGITGRKRRHLTKQDTKAAPAPDLVGRDFTAGTPRPSGGGVLPALAAPGGRCPRSSGRGSLGLGLKTQKITSVGRSAMVKVTRARRDVARHIRKAFAGLPVEIVLTVAQIVTVRTSQCEAGEMSAGAVDARLRADNVPGIRAILGSSPLSARKIT